MVSLESNILQNFEFQSEDLLEEPRRDSHSKMQQERERTIVNNTAK